MDLTPAEGRVLGCLIEKQVDGPAAYSLTLNELRFACNRADDREPLVTYDDRAIEETLMSLKSKGLARFVPSTPSIRDSGPVRCRHRADERWRLNPTQLTVLAVLLLRGPLTLDEVHARVSENPLLETPAEVEAILDSLAARTPTHFAARLRPLAGTTDVRWAEVLTWVPADDERLDDTDHTTGQEPTAGGSRMVGARAVATAANGAPPSPLSMVELADRLSGIERRLAGIEAAITSLQKLWADDDAVDVPPGSASLDL
jgi:uncharacterized protein